jgi:PAS domain S-box-containing protein
MDILRLVLCSDGFMPHGFCFLWNTKLLWLHALSDGLIFASYLSISFTLIYLARERRDLPYRWMFWYFGAFIVSCGFSHGVEVWTLWHPDYWISGAIKAVTAIVSVATAVLLVKLVRRPLAPLSFGPAAPRATGLRPSLGNRPLLLAYGLGVVAIVATLLVIEAAGPEAGSNAPVIMFIVPIVLSAYVGGLAPGLVSTALVTLVSIYYILPPAHAWRVTNPIDNLKWISLSVAGTLISVLMADRERFRVKQESLQVHRLLFSTERKVRAGFAFLLACLVAIAIVSYPTLVRLHEDAGRVEHSHEVIATLQRVDASVTEAQTHERGYIITGREDELQPYQSATEHAHSALRELRRLTADNLLQQRRLAMLEPVVEERMAVLQRGIKSRRKGFRQAKALVASGRAEQLQDRISAAIVEMESTEQKLLAEREVRTKRASTAARVVVVGGSALAVVIVGAGLLVIGAAFSASRRAEAALQESKDELEARVKERTSELVRANESLRASENRFRTLANAIPTLCWMANADGWITWYNQRWYEYTGTTPEEMEGWGWQSVHDPDVLPKVLQSWKTSIGTGKPFEMVFPLRGGDGTFHPFLTRIVPLLDDEGKITRWFGTNTDISEQRRTEEALRQSVERLEKVLQVETVGVMFWDLNTGCMVDANDAFLKLMGYSRSQVEARELTWQNLTPPEYMDVSRAEVEKFLATGRVGPYEKEYFRKDGTKKWLLFAGSSLGGNQCVEFCVDISDRKKAEETLRKSQLMFETLFECLPDAIVAADAEGCITQVNASAEKLFGYNRSELLGQPVELLMPERFRAAHKGQRQKFYVAPVSRPMGAGLQLYGRRKDGREFPADIQLSTIETESGHSVLTVTRDITERKQAADALARRTEELERSNAELEHFAYVASHDLQEPLRMVASFTQLLAKRYRGKLDSHADQFIEYAVDGARRMQDLINDLLAYSRVGTRGQEFAPTSCETVLEIALTNLKTAIEKAGARVTHDPLPTVVADQGQLCQVFQNLVGNAVKFRGLDAPHVHVSAEKREGEWRFSVRDNGIGIDAQDAERIFVIFERLHTSAEYPGTGIGLAISKKIIERHGGRIGVESEPGKGAAFYFTIPEDEHTGSGVK